MLTLLSRYVSSTGCKLLTATNGREALNVLHQEGADLVLSDWSMPVMDGLELCRAIRASEAFGFVYIILLTAHSEKDRVVQALEAGANDFLGKPCHRQELIARLGAGTRILELQSDLHHQQRELHKANAELAILNRKLEVMASTDELTGLANRREAIARLKSYWDLSIRSGQPFSCIMLDVDHFKCFNDNYGHSTGDLVLQQTAAALKHYARTSDVLCRVGGEEFLVLCPNSDLAMATQAAERLRVAVEINQIPIPGHVLSVTLSAGVAERSGNTATPEQLFKQVDQALYLAKQQGRNRVTALAGETHPCHEEISPMI